MTTEHNGTFRPLRGRPIVRVFATKNWLPLIQSWTMKLDPREKKPENYCFTDPFLQGTFKRDIEYGFSLTQQMIL